MLLLGCTPQNRNTEQHDVFFGIANELKDLLPDIYVFWPEAQMKIHLDAWREVRNVDGYRVEVQSRSQLDPDASITTKLFFLNLGGYKQDEFEEYHYKMLAACTDKTMAVELAKQSAFYKHTGFKSAPSHIDDKYGVDVDDIYEISDILPAAMKEKYRIVLYPDQEYPEDEFHLGYLRLEKLSQ